MWAPEVLRRRDGRYLLYFAAPSAAARTQCIGVALGRLPQGPFVPVGSEPLVCQPELGGSIDASPYRHAGGALYLVWKNDGNCCGYKTWIWGQRLTASGTRLTGQRAQLLTGEQPWDRQLVEAPLLHRRGDALVLFYSGAWVENYAVGYARCAGPLGPCTAARENPILRSGCAAVGTGHPALVIDDAKRTWMLYHASLAGGSPRGRLLWLDRVTWKDGASPAVVGPTCERRARPVVRTR